MIYIVTFDNYYNVTGKIGDQRYGAMRKPQTPKRAPIVKHDDQPHSHTSVALPRLALTHSSQVSPPNVREGILDGSVMIYTVAFEYYNATGEIDDQRYA